MKLLVLEENNVISDIYKKIFREKNYEADFAKNESECFEKFSKKYDFVLLEKSTNFSSGYRLEDKIKELEPTQKICFLSSYMKINQEVSEFMKETREIIEKPFALLAIIAQIELKHQKPLLHN